MHALNCTLTATSRTMCCILENYQTSFGLVIPPVLRNYMGGKEFLPFVDVVATPDLAASKTLFEKVQKMQV